MHPGILQMDLVIVISFLCLCVYEKISFIEQVWKIQQRQSEVKTFKKSKKFFNILIK